MYISDLEESTLPIDRIFLDPNNPRFSDVKAIIPDNKVHDVAVQARAQERIYPMGVEELYESLLRNGFLPLDRIVVRKLNTPDEEYVVVEGNRRLAALRLLKDRIETSEVDAPDLDASYLDKLNASIAEINCLVYTGSDTDIAWILQGIRHISGIRDWSPAQRAELVVKEKTERGLTLRAVGQMLGLSTQAVTKLYRGHKGLRQMFDDEDYGARADKSFFTLFDEAYGKPAVRSWLGWSDTSESFTNDENRRMFYAWISKDPENDGRRRIHDPRQIATLGKILAAGRLDLIDMVESYDLSIDEAKARLDQTKEQGDWRAELGRAREALSDIPITTIVSEQEDLLVELAALLATVQGLVEILSSDSGESAP